jgi:hypothetical protein
MERLPVVGLRPVLSELPSPRAPHLRQAQGSLAGRVESWSHTGLPVPKTQNANAAVTMVSGAKLLASYGLRPQ